MKHTKKGVAWAKKAIANGDIRVFLNSLVVRDNWLIGCDGFRGHLIKMSAATADGFYLSNRNKLTEQFDSIVSRYRPVAVRHEDYPVPLIWDTIENGYYDIDVRHVMAIEYAGTAIPEGQKTKKNQAGVRVSRVTLDRGAPVYVQSRFIDDLGFAPYELVFSPLKNAVIHLSDRTAGFVLCISVDSEDKLVP